MALESLTAYSTSAGSTKTASAARWSAASCSPSSAQPGLVVRRRHALDDHELLRRARIVDQHLEHEAVDLRLRQRVGAFRLDRVLRRHHEERVG